MSNHLTLKVFLYDFVYIFGTNDPRDLSPFAIEYIRDLMVEIYGDEGYTPVIDDIAWDNTPDESDLFQVCLGCEHVYVE